MNSIATWPDDLDHPGQTGCILSGSNQRTGLSSLSEPYLESAKFIQVSNEVMSEDKSSISSRSVSERVKQGDYTLKRKKNAKGSRAWEQFQTVCDENGDEVFGVACCANCKTCLLCKKLVNGEQKSMGTKNLLDHLKHYARGSSTSHECASGSSLSSTETLDSEGKPTIVTF